MKPNNKKAFSAFTLILSLIILVIIGLLIPNTFWEKTGSKSFNQLHIRKAAPEHKSVPGILKWKEPFQYKTKKENQ